MNTPVLTFYDCFAGAGGFRIGFERAGFKCIGFCEKDKWATRFYRAAHDTKGEIYDNDATRIIPGRMPDFNIFVGGFPCQAFSIAGKRQGFDDVRGTLFFEIVRICKVKKPKYIILENVKGLLNHDNGRTFSTIIKILTDIGYCCEWQVLNSKFFGVPQNRERVFIVGHLGKECAGKIFPIRKTAEVYNEAWAGEEEVHDIASTLKARDYANWGGNFIYQRPRGKSKGGIKDIAPTVSASSYQDNNLLVEGEKNGVYDGYKIRRLTPLECFRLQGFPDEVVKKAKEAGISDAQLYKIAGNSVTVNVVVEIAKRIMRIEAQT